MVKPTWQVGHEGSELQESIDVVLEGLVSDAGDGRVRLGASELLLSHRLAGHSLKERERPVRQLKHRYELILALATGSAGTMSARS